MLLRNVEPCFFFVDFCWQCPSSHKGRQLLNLNLFFFPRIFGWNVFPCKLVTMLKTNIEPCILKFFQNFGGHVLNHKCWAVLFLSSLEFCGNVPSSKTLLKMIDWATFALSFLEFVALPFLTLRLVAMLKTNSVLCHAFLVFWWPCTSSQRMLKPNVESCFLPELW